MISLDRRQSSAAETGQVYRELMYFREADEGRQFAAREQPTLFSEEVRASLRTTAQNRSKWRAMRVTVPTQKLKELDMSSSAVHGDIAIDTPPERKRST